ncbi:MAG TPA: peptidoglycan-binding protein [Sphingobacteriaceae bacterium]
MAKSIDLFKLLPLIAVFVYCYVSGINVGVASPGNLTPASGSSPSALRYQVKNIYDAQVGIKEQTGNNDGKKVEQYLRYVHLTKGQPWCAAFVCWVFGEIKVHNPRSGWSPALFPDSKVIWQRARLQPATHNPEPKPGDVFGIYFPEKKRVAHAGFIDEWGEKYAITVEGNTNIAGSREGDGVYRKRRLTSSLYQVSNWIDH